MNGTADRNDDDWRWSVQAPRSGSMADNAE
jgi:hypothetical protein